MATMATSHAMSVLANNSIKNPIDIRTGKIASLTKPLRASRKPNGVGFYQDIGGGIRVKIGANGDAEYTSDPVDVFSREDLSSHLKSLSDEEFYNKLSSMKEHQKRALEKCEKLYMEKKALEEKYSGVHYSVFDNEDIDIDTGTMLVNGTLMGYDKDSHLEYSDYIATRTVDNVCDLASKPPVAPNAARPPSRQGKRPAYSNVSPPVQWKSVRSRSLDGDGVRHFSDLDDEDLTDEELKGYMTNNFDANVDATTLLRRQDNTTPSKLELERIESMWDDFAINDYAPRRSPSSVLRQRPSSAPSSRSEKQKKPEWRHRLTIPQPFNMTLRQESREKGKTAAQLEVEEERLRKEQEEELECQKKFKAKPVPAHIYLPLYDEINEKNEARRRYAREYCQELLKSQEKPFKFMKREEHKLKLNQRRNSEPSLYTSKKQMKESKKFKAKPVPSFVYGDTVARKQMEDEEYRKLRICMRSEELLKDAALPPSMAAREKLKQQKAEEKKRQIRARKQFRPKVHRHIPDYDGLYKHFQRELARRKTEIEPTVMEPFRLQTSRIHTDTEKVLRDMARDEEVLVENRWPYRTPRSRTPTNTPRPKVLHTPMDTFPAKMTRAADSRNFTIRKSLEQLTEDNKKQEETERHRRIREMKMRKTISEKAGEKSHTKQSIRDRLRQFKEDERIRDEEYQSEINAIKQRVEQQPMLFERQRQTSAKNKAEKKFANTLKNVGLDEEFIYSRSSAPTSVRDEDDDNYDEERTYVKSSDHYTDSFEED